MSKSELATSASSDNGTIIGPSGATFTRKPTTEASGVSYVRLNTLKAGDVIVEGIYLGSTANVTYPEKQDFKFKTNDGKLVVVNEGGNLKSRLSQYEAGMLLLVIYHGMQKITKGIRAGKMAHNVEVIPAD